MPKLAHRNVRILLIEGQKALGMTQRELGEALGASQRTAVRWAANKATPWEGNLRKLAALLHPRSRALAAEVAASIGEDLVSLGLEAPPPAPPPPRADHLVDTLVLAAVEATGAAPAPMRAMLHAVFRRGTEVGLTMQAAEEALRPAVTSSRAAPPTTP